MSLAIAELELLAARCRRNVVRMVEAGGSGHLGGAMSIIDVLTTLYFEVLRIDPARPGWPQRDRFLLSAGHKAMGQYAVLAESRAGCRCPGRPLTLRPPGRRCGAAGPAGKGPADPGAPLAGGADRPGSGSGL